MKIGVKEASSRAKATSSQALSMSKLSIGFLCDMSWPTPGQTHAHQMPNHCMSQISSQPPTSQQPPGNNHQARPTRSPRYTRHTSPRPHPDHVRGGSRNIPLTEMVQPVAAVNELHHASYLTAAEGGQVKLIRLQACPLGQALRGSVFSQPLTFSHGCLTPISCMFALPVSFSLCRFRHDSLYPRPTLGTAYFRFSISHPRLTPCRPSSFSAAPILKSISRYTSCQATGERERGTEKQSTPTVADRQGVGGRGRRSSQSPSHPRPRLL
ncbi:hypothetical protein QBC45DRAFT_145634 [Copromyces sp. CBS 386.78]|nr:hypothetical protein QBC45DRAFT_145634 [Copromyces sp. CBS 386.78]